VITFALPARASKIMYVWRFSVKVHSHFVAASPNSDPAASCSTLTSLAFCTAQLRLKMGLI
jgi:hypothetical protein